MKKNISEFIKKQIPLVSLYIKDNSKVVLLSVFFLIVLTVYIYAKSLEPEKQVIHTKERVTFEGGRILGTKNSIYERKEKILSKKIERLEDTQASFSRTIGIINQKIDDLLGKIKKEEIPIKKAPEENKGNFKGQDKPSEKINSPPSPPGVGFYPSSESLEVQNQALTELSQSSSLGYRKVPPKDKKKKAVSRKVRKRKTSAVISFPVKTKLKRTLKEVKLPSGSFVKGKLLVGVMAPEGRALPVLIQLDRAFVGPNRSQIDLTGCFIIAKSTGNLSTEIVEMQTTKISCVSKSGRMFERKINGFVADQKTSSFGIPGKVHSKQGRVASMAFISSVVQGIGSAIQQLQTNTQTNSLGGTSTSITGSQASFIAAGGASSAAGKITDWYLKNAEGLKPQISVESGKDLFVIVKDTVGLPNWYFKRPKLTKKLKNSSFSFLSQILK